MPRIASIVIGLAFLCICIPSLPAAASKRINRSGYISITIDPILYESNIWETSHRISLDKFFTEQAADLGEALAEGLEKTAFRGQLRVLPGYKMADQEAFRDNGTPDTFLITVDIRSRYGLSRSSPLAACLSGASCFLLSPVNMFTYQAKTDATVSAFYVTPDRQRLRLVQETYRSEGEVSGDFYEAMNMPQELEWITQLTRDAVEDIRRQVLAEMPTELVQRSWRKAADNLAEAPTRRQGLPPTPGIKPSRVEEPTAEPAARNGAIKPGQSLNLQQLVRQVSPTVFKVQTDRGTGSGFVISERGFGITSLHVVEGAGAIEVRFHNGDKVPARVLQTRPDLDLAILSYRAAGRRQLPIGNSDRLKEFEQVIAIGYPLEFGLSITPGQLVASEFFGTMPLLRFDPEVQHGNSGGPLVNKRGEAVGIIFRKANDGARGTTLAMPINLALDLLLPLLDQPPAN